MGGTSSGRLIDGQSPGDGSNGPGEWLAHPGQQDAANSARVSAGVERLNQPPYLLVPLRNHIGQALALAFPILSHCRYTGPIRHERVDGGAQPGGPDTLIPKHSAQSQRVQRQ